MQNEIKELKPGMLFYGKSKKLDVYGYGILLGPKKENPKSWEVRTLTFDGEKATWKTQDVSAKSLKEDWPKLYQWVDA